MCGITGWIDYDRDLRNQDATLRLMTKTLARRGPDAEGIWSEAHAALGHRRLAVIDLDGGRQPMDADTKTGGHAVVTFCGEIYNYRELRKDLISLGHGFETQSDTEVLLRGYLEWGNGVATRLNGMYAFGVWDRRTEELVLVRDRMGVKPLFFYPTRRGLLFGSEPKAIFANPSASRRVSADGLREILDMVKTPERSIYDGMYEVRPGQIVTFNRTGVSKRTYWALEARPHTDSAEATVGTVREILTDTVQRQMISDVPLCTLLSGGLDSSTVTALAAKTTPGGDLRSFSVDFKVNAENFAADAVRGSPDAPFAKELAAHVGAKHTEVLLDSSELLDPSVRDSVLRAADGPPAYWGDMWPSLYLLFREIRRHSTVALSGEAADELFGGYKWFQNPAAIQAETFPWLTSGSARYFGGLRLLSPDLLGKLDIATYRNDSYQNALNEVPVLPDESAVDKRMREITYLNLTRFLQTLLDRKDRMSMAVGLEVRVPFCDHRLIDYVFNVPWSMKSFDGREKSLLRAAAKDLLPDSIYNRIKTPYPATQDPFYENGLRRELSELLSDVNAPARGLLDLDKVKAMASRSESAVSQPYNRGSLEVALWLNRWMKQETVDLVV
ncbi:asparagine synthase (glutamine-hydrolyzing) [Paraburkholderia phenazinium]|uniref:asparagine synthase (glutamine-hydrolyzing) n=1 Tax=Paraburkholderia phenazinium TaxID=60549 RepID=UPI001589A768|nr:asparagine synthase (glutamine-hydrolyzing) [Paraburkholderia phenazinium]